MPGTRSRYSSSSRRTSRMRYLRDFQHLPNIVLRAFGINHIFWGVILLILGFVLLGITANDLDTFWNPLYDRWRTYAYYAPVTVIFASILFIIAGVLGLATPMSFNPIRRAALESGFKILSILISVIFGPLVFGIGLSYAILVDTDEALGGWGVAVAVIAGILTFITWFVGCMACCWAPYYEEEKICVTREVNYACPPPCHQPSNIYSVDPCGGAVGRSPAWIKHF